MSKIRQIKEILNYLRYIEDNYRIVGCQYSHTDNKYKVVGEPRKMHLKLAAQYLGIDLEKLDPVIINYLIGPEWYNLSSESTLDE